jgi:hypothetical protein
LRWRLEDVQAAANASEEEAMVNKNERLTSRAVAPIV